MDEFSYEVIYQVTLETDGIESENHYVFFEFENYADNVSEMHKRYEDERTRIVNIKKISTGVTKIPAAAKNPNA